MYVIATFEQSVVLELAITALEQRGVARTNILAVPLDKREAPQRLFDSIHGSDGFSMLELAAVLGTVFMLLGAIYGYVLPWGPILCGLTGAIGGISLGLLIKYAMVRKKLRSNDGYIRPITSEVVLMIACDESKWETIEQALWQHTALGVSRIRIP